MSGVDGLKGLLDKAKYVQNCEMFPSCWGDVVRVEDVAKSLSQLGLGGQNGNGKDVGKEDIGVV